MEYKINYYLGTREFAIATHERALALKVLSKSVLCMAKNGSSTINKNSVNNSAVKKHITIRMAI